MTPEAATFIGTMIGAILLAIYAGVSHHQNSRTVNAINESRTSQETSTSKLVDVLDVINQGSMEKDRQIAGLQFDVTNLKAGRLADSKSIQESRENIVALARDKEQMATQIAAMGEELSKRDETIAQLSRELATTREEFSSRLASLETKLRVVMAEKDRLIEELTQAISERDAARQERDAVILERDSARAELERLKRAIANPVQAASALSDLKFDKDGIAYSVLPPAKPEIKAEGSEAKAQE